MKWFALLNLFVLIISLGYLWIEEDRIQTQEGDPKEKQVALPASAEDESDPPEQTPEERIGELLRKAEACFQFDQLISPPGWNALECYWEVLELDPGNQKADEGLKRIVGRYVELAEERIGSGAWAEAKKYLDTADSVVEGDQRVIEARARLKAAQVTTTTTTTQQSTTTTSRATTTTTKQPTVRTDYSPTTTTLPPPTTTNPPATHPSTTGDLPKYFTNSIGMRFRLIPAGSFMMGSEYGRPNEMPVHKVAISKPFYMGVYEVTKPQWQAVMGSNPCYFVGSYHCPVVNVSWGDVQWFIEKLNIKEGAYKYRLPTEAEWEYACRAGTRTDFSFGDDVARLGEYAWYDKNAGNTTHLGGKKKPNPWGLYDMHGNVWEWCEDWYDKDYYSQSPQVDPKGPDSGSHRVLRGGSENNSNGWYLRSALRNGTSPGSQYSNCGFRLVRVTSGEVKPTSDRQRKIDALLKEAKAHIEAGRLVAPIGNNAMDCYSAVRDLDPGNAEAWEGTRKISDWIKAQFEQQSKQ